MTQDEAGTAWNRLLEAEDAIMDPLISAAVERHINDTLLAQGIDPHKDPPLDLIHSIELNAVSGLIRNYSGLAKVCEFLAEWCRDLDEMQEMLVGGSSSSCSQVQQVAQVPAPQQQAPQQAPQAAEGVVTLRGAGGVGQVGDGESPVTLRGGGLSTSGTSTATDGQVGGGGVVSTQQRSLTSGGCGRSSVFTPSDYLTEGLCLILSQNFQPDPFKQMLAEQEGGWTPPPFYWALLRDGQVVETLRRLYDRNRGSEFLGAFLQDYCERHERLSDGFKVSSAGQLSEITAHFSIFTKAFGELLVEFLVEDDTYEFGDRDPHNISRLLCHAENAYCYAQALLHFLPYCQAEFSSCRRLSQLIFRNLRETKAEFACADRLLLCTALPNYPDLFELFKNLRDTDERGRLVISGESLTQICDALARVNRRFEKHRTLLLFQEANPLPPQALNLEDQMQEITPNEALNPHFSWESEMLRDDHWGGGGGGAAAAAPTAPTPIEHDLLDDDDFTLTAAPPAAAPEEHNGSGANGSDQQRQLPPPSEIIQEIDWPVAAEVKAKASLPVFWNLPSASQAGDEEVIAEEAEDESDRRGSTKLVLPPMDAIRETQLLDQLFEFLVCPRIPNQPTDMPVGKLVELIIMLTTLTNYELVVQHLQRQAAQEETVTWKPPEQLQEDEQFQQDTRLRSVITAGVHFSAMNSQTEAAAEAAQAAADAADAADDDSQQPLFSLPPPTNFTGVRKRSISGALPQPPPPLVSGNDAADEIRKKRPRLAASVVSSYIARSQVPSMLESNVYKDPHEGSRLRAFKPEDKAQCAKLQEMFSSCADAIETYKRIARRDLFEIYHLARRQIDDPFSDHSIMLMSLRIGSSAGASAVLRFFDEVLLPEDIYRKHNTSLLAADHHQTLLLQQENTNDNSPSPIYPPSSRPDPVNNVTPALLSLMMRISLWHPRKRVLVMSLFKRLLEESFGGPSIATEETQNQRRRVLQVAIAQMGIADRDFECAINKLNVPWRAGEADWKISIIPGYKLVFNMVRELLPCFDVTLLRETLESILDLCAAPYSMPFAASMCDLLRSVALLNLFDFELPINAALKHSIQGVLENILAVWAPDCLGHETGAHGMGQWATMQVLQKCQVIGECVGMTIDPMPLAPTTANGAAQAAQDYSEEEGLYGHLDLDFDVDMGWENDQWTDFNSETTNQQ